MSWNSTLQSTLKSVFGHEEFRDGQQQVCEAAIQGRDTCVFWATGKGKSLCYQLPAFHLQKTVVVISPLISLMQDQVIKLNSTIGEGKYTVAVSLTSHDTEPGLEELAFSGRIRLIYVSPERATNPAFISRLVTISKYIALIAIDEAHCIGQWGFDFRKDYQMLHVLRQTHGLHNIPLMALTATSTASNRSGIAEALMMRNPYISTTTVHRPNLAIATFNKIIFAQKSDRFYFLINKLKADQRLSGIVYCSTRAEVEDICQLLQESLRNEQLHSVQVGMYHAGLSPVVRKETHVKFLSDDIQIIVATTAFGMGIDKPDIRVIVHHTPPKSFEEYYQQIGRAGRDGLLSYCQLLYTDQDFVKYKSDFYMGKLPHKARVSAEASLESLRLFASNNNECRNSLILKYFEVGSAATCALDCSLCHAQKNNRYATKHDYTDEARLIIQAVLNTSKLGVSSLVSILWGSYKKYVSTPNEKLMTDLNNERKMLKSPFTQSICKELFESLVQEGILTRHDASVTSGTYKNVYVTYKSTLKAMDVLAGKNRVIMNVPPSVGILVANLEAAAEKRNQELVEAGVDISAIPVDELKVGKGPVISTFMHWVCTIRKYRSTGQDSRADHLEEMLKQILTWRNNTARTLNMAPGYIMSTHLAHKIAYTQPTDLSALRDCGVRVAGAEELLNIIRAHCQRFTQEDLYNNPSNDASIYIPETFRVVNPAMLPKGKKIPTWHVSYEKFQVQGIHVQTIAATQASGKPILTGTVVNHILTALNHGYPVDLKRLFQSSGTVILCSDWQKVAEGFAGSNTDPLDKAASMKAVISAILGPELIEKENKSPREAAIISDWYDKIRYYMAFKRAGIPDVEPVESFKRQKL